MKEDAVKSVDEWKGRVVQDRRWPADCIPRSKSRKAFSMRPEGVILGSITLQNLIALYPEVCGMTGTAASQAEELLQIYGLAVEKIPTNRPLIRVDHRIACSETKARRNGRYPRNLARSRNGQPVLVGTASVEESERLSALSETFLICPKCS